MRSHLVITQDAQLPIPVRVLRNHFLIAPVELPVRLFDFLHHALKILNADAKVRSHFLRSRLPLCHDWTSCQRLAASRFHSRPSLENVRPQPCSSSKRRLSNAPFQTMDV